MLDLVSQTRIGTVIENTTCYVFFFFRNLYTHWLIFSIYIGKSSLYTLVNLWVFYLILGSIKNSSIFKIYFEKVNIIFQLYMYM